MANIEARWNWDPAQKQYVRETINSIPISWDWGRPNPWVEVIQSYCQADIDLTLNLYDRLPFYPSCYIVTAPFSHSTTVDEAMTEWLEAKGYTVERRENIRIISDGSKKAMLAALKTLGVRVYSVGHSSIK